MVVVVGVLGGAESAHRAQRLAAFGRGTGAGRATRHRVAGAWADGEGGSVATLGDGVQLPQTAEQPEEEEEEGGGRGKIRQDCG